MRFAPTMNARLLLVFVFTLAGCAWRPSQRSLAGSVWYRPSAQPTAAAQPPRAFTPAFQAAQSLLTRRLSALPAPATCPRVETAPGRWSAPLCEPLPAVDVSLFVSPKSLAERACLPRAVDLREQHLVGPVKDQQQVGVCWAFATASVIDNAIRRSGDPASSVSPLHIVATTSWTDIALGRPNNKPVTVDHTWPYDPRKACAFERDANDTCRRAYGVVPNSWRQNPALVAELAHADSAHRYRLGRARHLEAKPANIPQLSQTLAEGTAILAVIAIDRQAWGWRAAGDGIIDDYSTHDTAGHAVAIVGYRTTSTETQFLIKNSWGRAWAHDGYAWMSAENLTRNLLRAMVVSVSPTQPGLGPPAPRPQRNPLPSPCDLLAVGGLCNPAAPPLAMPQLIPAR